MPPATQPGASGHARDSAAIDKQIANSNATASAFLGSRQPSWVTSSTAQKKATTSRPALSRPPVAPPVQQQHQSAVLPSPDPSDEPSPALSNTLDSPGASTAPTAEANNMASTTASIAAMLPVTTAQFVLAPSETPATQGLARPDPSGPASTAESRVPAVGNHSRRSSASASQDNQGIRSSTVSLDGGSAPASVHPLLPPLKRRRTDQPSPSRATLLSLLPALEQISQSCDEDATLEQGIGKPRIALLREACESQDEFFLVFHQLFCIWSVNPQDCYACVRLHQQRIDSAFTTLETVLRKNTLLAPALLHWFAQFPVRQGDFSRGQIGGSAILTQIAIFLDKLSMGYRALSESALHRGYPFLVDELLNNLNCYSPVLQYILFTACRRRLGVLDGHLGSQIEQAFRGDQNRHRDAVTGRHICAPITYPGEVEQRNASLINYYKQVVEAAALQSPGSVGPRTLGGTAAPSPIAALQQPGRVGHLPSTQVSQQRQEVVNPYTLPLPFGQAYPSSALPPAPVTPTTAVNPYTTHPHSPNRAAPQSISSAAAVNSFTTLQRNPNRTAPPSGVSSTAIQQSPLATSSPALHQRAAVNSIPHPQIQPIPSMHPLHQRHAFVLQQQRNTPQQLGRPQYQQNVQVTAGFPQLPPLRIASHVQVSGTQPARAVQPVQASQIQQAHFVAGAQPVQSPMVPVRSTIDRSHPQLISTAPSAAPPTRNDGVQAAWTLGMEDRLLPPKGSTIQRPDWPFDPSDKKSILMSLHQADARSPKRVIKDGVAERFYQAVKSLVVGPAPIPPKNTLYGFRFEVSKEQIALAATKSNQQGMLLPLVEHFNGALRWRVRSCSIPQLSTAPTEQGWTTLDVDWPENIHITLNDTPIVVRRKTHHGKDIAAELTDFIVCGVNVLKLSVPDVRRAQSRNRFVAVELLETLSHSTIVKSVWSRGVLPEEATLSTIKKRLTPSVDNDVAFGAPDLSIDLADPFSATIFKVPARGAACTHMECFDLETWLNTRPAKPPVMCPHGKVACTCSKTTEPSNPDKWRCPICFKDARPYSLRIDSFLLKVRAQLEEEGKLQTKSMRVRPDGSWSVVLDAAADDDDDDNNNGSDDEGGTIPLASSTRAKAKHPPAAARKEIEIIEID